MKTRIPPVLVTFALVCFALVQNTQAVSPAPDGGYANANTAEGSNALFSLTTGVRNTADGYLALFFNTSGRFNTGTGAQALYNNTTGVANTADGMTALFHNSSGEGNTATGFGALFSNTTASNNTANGYQALYSNTSGFENTASGNRALFSNNTGTSNTAVGDRALESNTIGQGNTAIGDGALADNTISNGNTAVGLSALALGGGTNNIALGFLAGHFGVGDNDIYIGNQGPFSSESNTIRIGDSTFQNACFVAGIFNATASGGTAVYINSNGQIGTSPSSARFKQDIRAMDKASEALFALRPVTFHYKKEIDPNRIPQFGLVAEDVEKVKPDLVVYDKEGKPYSVRYDAVNAMLLNEFLKEHKKTEKLEATVASLIATVKEQAAQIQKVSAQLEASKPSPQVVNNP